jgi:hypothetical protein
VPPRPDSQSFTKFVISAGALLVVAAFVVPGLVLRDTAVLTIPVRDLKEFTPTARGELEQRQTLARDGGRVAPYAGAGFLLGGLALILVGIPRLRRQERTADEHAEAELNKLLGEIQPQTAKEQKERLEADVEDSSKPPGVSSPATKEQPRGKVTSVETRSSQLQRWSKVEAEVLQRLAEIAPPRYDLQTRVKLEGASSKRLLLLDALLISQVDQFPDIVVEVKFAGKNLSKNIGNRVAEAESQLLRYLARYRRDSIGWLILYVIDELDIEKKKEIADRAGELADVLKVSIVTQETLPSLSLPVPS